MSVLLSAAMEQAQAALNGGDYRVAAERCNRIVAQFPALAAAYRMLGEAHVELGNATEAEASFAQVLSRDPRRPEAYLGLGLVSEARGALDNSLAYCQVAWELAPHRPYYREPVLRVAALHYGGDGFLQLTHPALAQLHFNAARLQRAASEYQTALAALPDRVDLWLGLAVTFWRLGKDDDAAEIAREFLKEHPELGQALLIVSDIDYRCGNLAEAEEARARLRSVDADGALAAAMIALNPRAAGEFLLLTEEELPVLEDGLASVVDELPYVAPAHDFDFQQPRPEAPNRAEAASLAAAGMAAGFAAAMDQAPDDSGEAVEPAGIAGSPEDTNVEPFAFDELLEADPGDVDSLDGDTVEYAEMPRAELDEAGMRDLLAEFEGLTPLTPEEFYLPGEDAPAADLSSFDFSFETSEPAPPHDHLADLAQALEGEVAGALARAGEPVDLPATPQPAAAAGFTSLLNELGAAGPAPFDPAEMDDVMREGVESDPTEAVDELLAVTDLDFDPISLVDLATDEHAGDGVPPAASAAVALDGIEDEAELVSDLMPPGAGISPADEEYLAGIEPFSIDELDEPLTGDFGVGRSLWETTTGSAALPSDEDLDAMLADVPLPPLATEGPGEADREAQTGAFTDEEVASAEVPDTGHITEQAAPNAQDVAVEELDASLAVTHELAASAAADDDVASDSINTLRLSLETAPDDDELHWLLAEALRDSGDPQAALGEYRWLIRNTPQRHDQVTGALLQCVERGQEAELAHRLLSDAYRRRGDTQRASAHAAQAMAERRRHR